MSKVKRNRSSIDLYSIGESTSKFGKNAEEFLSIVINDTDNFNDILSDFELSDTNDSLKNLYLEDIDEETITSYKSSKYRSYPKNAQSFLYYLSMVEFNNRASEDGPHIESRIHDLMEFLLREANFQDGTDLLLVSSVLTLTLETEGFAARADKEGRRGTEIVWIIDEDKHHFDNRYKKGDIQLIANMLAAVQKNRVILDKIYPSRMIGIKFDATNIYFYSFIADEEYMDELTTGIKSNLPLNVNKFPKTRKLSLLRYKDRKEIFTYLSTLRKYALSLEDLSNF
jgi:hypothetical protein